MSETIEYALYPLTMAHPAFVAAKSLPVPGTEIRNAAGNIVRQDYRGTPERLPPVTVGNEQEEEYYRAQGYERAGRIDPSAWVQAHSDAPSAEYVPQKYPLWRDGVLYMTAQEDPGASEEDLLPDVAAEPDSAAPEPPQAASEAENLRAMMAEMNRTMQAMSQQMAEQKTASDKLAAENEALRTELTTQPKPTVTYEVGAAEVSGGGGASAKRPPGRPRKAA